MVPDETRRFRRRPHFRQEEIDRECETLVAGFLMRHRGKVEYPISTDDLTVLIEQHVDVLDVYADLTPDGHDVEGVTRFKSGAIPDIEISKPLSTDTRRENRYRTTLAHELGHVRLHDGLFQAAFTPGDMFEHAREHRLVCKRDTMLDAPKGDWLEWQACYASGSYLMPVGAIRGLLAPILAAQDALAPYQVGEGVSDAMIEALRARFQVSRDAARVRLLKLNYISSTPRVPTLFG
ncbi:ImmA/IrrE family metallo-endopeptidase [Methylobacterium sp. Leaf89]|nr:ImmA/IrrE family metallo-endopeptidase [Methylobacterium sp. Leaf89]